MDIRPIFVIGMNRSGTKWLSNILCNHQDVIAVQSDREQSGGILETNMFGNMQRIFGDLLTPDDYIGFIELWSQTDFFKLTTINKELFYKLRPRPNNYMELYEILMKNFAEQNHKKFWLQKLSPFSALSVMSYFKKANYVIIKRNAMDTMKSNIKIIEKSSRRCPSILKVVFMNVIQEKLINQICKKKKILSITYKDIKVNPEEKLKPICKKIGIDFRNSMLNMSFRKNTSFESNLERSTYFSKGDFLKINLFLKILRIFPFYMLLSIKNIFFIFQRNINSSKIENELKHFVFDTFGIIKDKYKIS